MAESKNSKFIELTRSQPDETSKAEIDRYYENNFIPPEKKPFLTDLKNGVGAYLSTDKGRFILDGSSQIATLGLGFNPSIFFGVTHFSEAWLNTKDTADFATLRKNYEAFFARKLGWDKAFAFFCNAGAEANEVALGHCFDSRINRKAHKVLSFEGSFHGRMIVSLTATSNASKREPYEWPSFKGVFAPWPEMKTDHSHEYLKVEGWNRSWEQAAQADFEKVISSHQGKDSLLDLEIASLLAVRAHLLSGDIFAIILEPRQCEGGDRYASFRFHNGLVNLARAFSVPVIYDEVQCGFGLSGEFFWHRLFDLRDGSGKSMAPDYVTCAKKAQLGIAISQKQIPYSEQYASHSLIRGYAQAMMMDQYKNRIIAMAEHVRPLLKKWVTDHKNDLENPRLQGLSFSVDFKEKTLLDRFINKRFENGLLYYPAGSNTARFRLNLSYRDEDIALLFEECTQILEAARNNTSTTIAPLARIEVPKSHSDQWEFHLKQSLRQAAELKAQTTINVSGSESPGSVALSFLNESITFKQLGLECDWVQKSNFPKYQAAIQTLQVECYEEARQTPTDEFENALAGPLGFGIVVKKGNDLVAISFLGNLNRFADERGAKSDPHFSDVLALYSMDLAVSRKYQGQGLGQLLKEAAYLGALSLGATRIEGRNRDGKAAPMFAINLSLGAYELQHLPDDYPDNEKQRDCLYYSKRLHWTTDENNLNSAIDASWDASDLSPQFVESAYGCMVNKVCLSNFVSRDFLENLKFFASLLHAEMRHAYTASGQSEAVDKIIKSLWTYRKIERLVSFKDCYFGSGSFMSRGLSNIGEPFFPVTHLDYPDERNWKAVLNEVAAELKRAPAHSLWIEPLCQKTLKRAPEEFLFELVLLTKSMGLPLVFNDTASLFYRYDRKGFAASSIFGPDAAMSFVGGQMAVSYFRKDFYVSKPLEIISTWDGDEYSLAAFSEAARNCVKAGESYFELCANFESSLKQFLAQYPVKNINLKNGVGNFEGTLPTNRLKLFNSNGASTFHSVAATSMQMQRFIENWKEL